MDEIREMEVGRGVAIIKRHMKEQYDREMINKIDMFSAHGVDVMKIEVYRDYINGRQKDQVDELERDMMAKGKNKPQKIDSEIEKEILKMQMQARKK